MKMLILPSTLLYLLLSLSVLITSTFGDPECDAVITDDGRDEMAETLAAVNLNYKRQTFSVRNHTFGVHFHVVASNLTVAGGWIPQKQIDDQMELMNRQFTGTGAKFRLLNVTRILSRHWHQTVDRRGQGVSQMLNMKTLFRRGSARVLNVYTVGFYTRPLNGFATFPVDAKANLTDDGVVLLFNTLPGGASRERQGGTLVHEVGHWLGLFHTFQNGCDPGDGVDDTAPEAEAARGCPIGKKSCPGSDLPDPIHNFMDYTDESCRTEFTPGQIDRMQRSIIAYRDGTDE